MTPEVLSSTHAEAFGPNGGWSSASFAKLLRDPGILLTGTSQSFVLGRIVETEAEILTIATAPSFQSKGLATAVLHQFMELAADAGATSVFLEVAIDNAPARAIYAKAGFKTVGERKNYYRRKNAPRVTALILKHEFWPEKAPEI